MSGPEPPMPDKDLATKAWVGDDGRGGLFSAHVEFAEEGPFSWVMGPHDVSAREAVGWARAHARRVVVRVGEDHFSGGEEPVGELPPWPPEAMAASRPAADAPGVVGRWRVEAHVNWLRHDPDVVAGRFADALQADERTSNVTHWLAEWGFAVEFVVSCLSTERHETGSRVLRAAWTASDVDCRAGEDHDVSSIAVTAA